MQNFLIFLLGFLAISPIAYAQQPEVPEFNSEYFRCENKWVLLPKKTADSTYSYGFVYLDRTAGFTYDHQGSVHISNTGIYTAVRYRESSLKYRLEPNSKLMAIIAPEKITEMKLPFEPEWLAIYRKGEDETAQLIRRGYHFNHVGGSDLAIPLLEQAYAREPHAEGLEFELAYAYNATGTPEKAIALLIKALEKAPNNFMFLRELGYAYMLQKNNDEAEKIYIRGIKLSTDKVQQAEMAYNVAGIYYRDKNEKKFKEWAGKVRRYADNESVYVKSLEKLEADFNK